MRRIELARWPAAPAVSGAVAGTWVAGFNWTEPRGALLAVPLVVVGIAALYRRPKTGAALVVAAGFAALAGGAPWGSIDMVLPFAIALFAVGRAERHWLPGIVAVVFATVPTATREGFTGGKFSISLVLHATMWGFGVIVRHRALSAYRAVAEETNLSREDPAQVSSRLAIEERSKLANEALFVLRAAIVRMRTAAHEAAAALDSALVREVHERGVSAVDELRQLLGLLREPQIHPPEPETSRLKPLWRTDAVLAAGMAILLTVVLIATPSHAHSFGGMALYAGTVVALGLRRSRPALACLTAAIASIAAIADPPTVPDTLLPAAAGYAMLTWTVTSHGNRESRICLGLLSAAGLAVSTEYGPDGFGFVLFVFIATALAGHAWSEHDRILREAEHRSERFQARLDRDTKMAVRAERLQLARELHDVTSHSVGAMVLQASAARALCERDPEAARTALRIVIATSAEALSDVDELFAALDAGELARATRPYTHPGQLRAALEQLVESMRRSGMNVQSFLGELPESPPLTATIFRIVQEGLTNAARYAPGAAVEVMASQEHGDYVVRVSDDGNETRGAMGSGYGIAGLRERVEACAGTFFAGDRSDCGFLIEARLPLFGGRAEDSP